MMKKDMTAFLMIVMVFCLSAVLFTGCAKKEVVKEDAGVSEDQQAAARAKAEADARRRAEEDARRKAQEQADRERAAREAAAREAAEREAAQRRQAAAAAEPAAYEFADIHFDFDKYALRPGDRDILKKHGEWLIKNGDYGVVIEGHCDERGTAEYNLALGEKRALEAKKYLVELSVSDKRISTVSYGKERPLDPGHTEEAWAKNRRAHFVVNRKK